MKWVGCDARLAARERLACCAVRASRAEQISFLGFVRSRAGAGFLCSPVCCGWPCPGARKNDMSTSIPSSVSGTVWKIEAAEGQQVARGDSLLLVESMKMEIPIEAPGAGRMLRFLVAEGETVAEGQALVAFEAA
jgi:biotin carboxyl carrier protein